ncbi:MaoC family dehydratase N-terminal domain-containing protein [Inquilinus sp. YAF38]|uniref:FAS1-like dehydratase domain-containing protein n=1 Tax=Inquilinus sp. YAF38 TaxID=3233084 RepID=UPI003F8EE73E
MTDIDIDRLRSWIGREEVAEDIVTADLVRKFRATLDFPGAPPQEGEAVPRLIHFCLAQPAAPTASLGPDGHPQRGDFLPPVPLPRRMWAGGSVTFHGELRVGDRVRRVSRIGDVVAKEGRSGLLCFVTVDHSIEMDGLSLLQERQDLVYRGLDGGAAKPAPAPAEPGHHRRRVDASPPLLFRYSALTFNGHRIHYDRRYVAEVEGYPGLVVHGPLQATLLLHFAAEIRGTPPARFDFRSLSPLFDDDPVILHAKESGDGLTLWTARENGPVAMTAEAGWA